MTAVIVGARSQACRDAGIGHSSFVALAMHRVSAIALAAVTAQSSRARRATNDQLLLSR